MYRVEKRSSNAHKRHKELPMQLIKQFDGYLDDFQELDEIEIEIGNVDQHE
jgi:hypothetical protein